VKFFVTGGAGFIGSALTTLLARSEHEVVVYDTFERGRREWIAHPRVSSIEGDVRDRARLVEAVRASRPEHVVHLAALHFIPDCIARPEETRAINVEGTRILLEACRCESVRSIGFASSAAVYAPNPGACNEATTPLGPSDVYGESKLRGEELAREHFESTGTPVALLRIFNAIGPRETNPHLIPHVLETLRDKDVLSLGNVHPKRDYIDTRDLASGILAVVTAARGVEPYNLGTGVAASVAEIVALLAERLERPLRIEVDPKRVRATDNPLLLADIAKVRADMRWSPVHELGSSLDELIVHYEIARGPRDRA
jgi:UDP-glucose 4-epimerase